MLHNRLYNNRSSISKRELKNRCRRLTTVLTFFVLTIVTLQAQTVKVDHFDKIIVSPYIEVTFKQGDQEAVIIEDLQLPKEKFNIEVNGKTLHVYLEGAKSTTKHKKVYKKGVKMRVPIYNRTMVKATIVYKDINELSLRGEEKFICESPLEGEDFRLKIYGESEVYIKSVNLQSLLTTIYGESYLEIKKGNIDRQKYTVYGESRVNTLGVDNQVTKITCYGESDFRCSISDNLKVTAFGEATIAYDGDPNVDKGIVLGEATIRRMQ